ncbi:hypothetical protein PENSPDRAFT_648330 [Peniophora sp. CONT]|nr:hypothetical protein PENSPDRAFT_648330 [Peniophora sp. CONT]
MADTYEDPVYALPKSHTLAPEQAVTTGQATTLAAGLTSGDAGQPSSGVRDALSYLDTIKEEYETQPEVYAKFMDIMSDFRTSRIDIPEVIQRVSELFHGKDGLILGLNAFLPPGHRIQDIEGATASTKQPELITVITPQGTVTAPSSELAHAIRQHAPQNGQEHASAQAAYFARVLDFLNRIQPSFEADPNAYKTLLEILLAARARRAQVSGEEGSGLPPLSRAMMHEVYDEVATALKDHAEVTAEFKKLFIDEDVPESRL